IFAGFAWLGCSRQSEFLIKLTAHCQVQLRKDSMAKAVTMAREGEGNKLTQFPTRVKTFLSDVRNEMRKVTFPNRKEVQATTTVVIITVLLFGIYFFVIDQVIATGISWV